MQSLFWGWKDTTHLSSIFSFPFICWCFMSSFWELALQVGQSWTDNMIFAYGGRSDLSQWLFQWQFSWLYCSTYHKAYHKGSLANVYKEGLIKAIYSYNYILLPCNSHFICNDISRRQILRELRDGNLLDYPLVQGFLCSVHLDS